MKRGELSMEVIIIAAIALLVLVVLTVLLLRSGEQIGKQCKAVGGTCNSQGSCGEGSVEVPYSDCAEGTVCCKAFNTNTQ